MNTEEDKAAVERRARKAAAARARRHDPAVRAREAEAARARRQADPELRAREAEARRQHREQAQPTTEPEAARARAAEAERAQRETDPELRAREAEARRKRRQADPEAARAREAAAKGLQRSLPEVGGADARFKRDFLDRSLERPAGGVGIYVKLPDTAEDLHLPLTNQSRNGEHAAVKLSNGIVVMTMYLAPNLPKGNIVTRI